MHSGAWTCSSTTPASSPSTSTSRCTSCRKRSGTRILDRESQGRLPDDPLRGARAAGQWTWRNRQHGQRTGSANPCPASGQYAASKGGLLSLARNLALEYARPPLPLRHHLPRTIDSGDGPPAARAAGGAVDGSLARLRTASAAPISRIGAPRGCRQRRRVFLASDKSQLHHRDYLCIDAATSARRRAWTGSATGTQSSDDVEPLLEADDAPMPMADAAPAERASSPCRRIGSDAVVAERLVDEGWSRTRLGRRPVADRRISRRTAVDITDRPEARAAAAATLPAHPRWSIACGLASRRQPRVGSSRVSGGRRGRPPRRVSRCSAGSPASAGGGRAHPRPPAPLGRRPLGFRHRLAYGAFQAGLLALTVRPWASVGAPAPRPRHLRADRLRAPGMAERGKSTGRASSRLADVVESTHRRAHRRARDGLEGVRRPGSSATSSAGHDRYRSARRWRASRPDGFWARRERASGAAEAYFLPRVNASSGTNAGSL